MPELQGTLRVLRPADLLVLEVELVNLQLSADGSRLERVDGGAPAYLVVRLPSQHVAERAYLEFENTLEHADPPPVAALAAAPSRLAFTLPDGVPDVAFSVDALLDWGALLPRLAPNALPPGAADGPAAGVPAVDETAIELPYRLLLSPDPTGRWTHRRTAFTVAGRTELWHTLLSADRAPIPLRAVGRRPVRDTFRSALSARDLDDLVTLTADFTIRPKSASQLGIPIQQWMLQLRQAGLFGFHYKPRPLEAERLILSALGASVRMRGHWTYASEKTPRSFLLRFGMPAPSLVQFEQLAGQGRDQFVRVVRRGFVHPGQRASLVKVTERRFELGQIDTRPTPQGPVAVFGSTAYLRQYYKVVLQEPLMDFAALAGGFTHHSREMPLRTLRFTTLVTPKIDLPSVPQGPGQPERPVDPEAIERQVRLELAGGPIDELEVQRTTQERLEALLQKPFWITAGNEDFEFSFVATDWEGRPVTGSTPLLFIPDEAIDATEAVRAAFAVGPATRRRRPFGNQSIAVADPAGGVPGSTRVPVESLTFTLQAIPAGPRNPPLPETYRPGWVMGVQAHELHIEAVERLTGSSAAREVVFADAYLSGGLAAQANPAGAFATLTGATTVPVSFGGERGGGIARPDAPVKVLSSRQGALPAAFAGASVDTNAIKALFGNARIFGTVALGDVVAAVGNLGPEHFSASNLTEEELAALLGDPQRHLEVPVLRTRSLERDGRPFAVETRYLWKPRLTEAPPPAQDLFAFEDRSELVLDSRTLTLLDSGETRSDVRGELRHFGLKFFGVVLVRMDRLAFTAVAGGKSDITAEGLDIEFQGPLEFVNSLRNVLPADGFSDPPAVEVTPAGISAGYSLGIPSVGVGVFALENLVLSTALTVPFTERPAGLRFAISERHHPFLVTVTLFGGGGFFALGVSAKGVEEIEAAIEFGGNISLNLGVASGGVHVMAGVYFGLTGEVTTLTGYLRCGGYLSVLGLITISIEFYLAFTYRAKDGGGSEIWGQASVTVSVKVACFSKSVTLSVEKRFAGASGDPTLEQTVDPDDWEAYCLAFAAEDAA